jgi:murein DD-endopeptidase MepM/ murein hydrolase activator NlpD
MSISQGSQAKPFNGAMMPIAFVPDWKKSDYVEQRVSLDYSSVKQTDLIPLPKVTSVFQDFNSNFTYLTMFRGKYMDESRVIGAGSHDGVDIRAPIGTPVFSIAHGKVIKVRNDADNKYITIEHRDVKYGGKVGKFYSSYLHLSWVLVQPWEIIEKGTLIGRVGMTGMTTTPHLHIQIDNEWAPFYPYWPFDYNQAAEAGMDMFEAVDAWLNQDLILKYSVDPLDFITHATTIDGPSVASERTEYIWNRNTKSQTQAKKIVPDTISITSQSSGVIIKNYFSDVTSSHEYFNAITYLYKKGVLKWYKDGTFGPEKTINRAELLSIMMDVFELKTGKERGSSPFIDVPKNHWINSYIGDAIHEKLIHSKTDHFYPNRNATKTEFLAMLLGATNELLPTGITKKWDDVRWSDWYYRYAVFASQNGLFDNINGKTFSPNKPLTRGEVAEALYRYLRIKNKL